MKLFEDSGLVIYWFLLLASAYAHFEHVGRLCALLFMKEERRENFRERQLRALSPGRGIQRENDEY